MANSKIAIALVKSLAEGETVSSLLSDLKAGIRRDLEAEAQLDQARDERDTWLKAGRNIKLTWPVMMESAGLSRRSLSLVFKNETPTAESTDRKDILKRIATSAAAFQQADAAYDLARAERNELVRRAYMGDVPVSELAKVLVLSESSVYDILEGRWSKQLKK